MKRNNQFWIPLATVFCLMATNFSVNAELFTPQDIVNQFNGSKGQGFQFTTINLPNPDGGYAYDTYELRRLRFENRGAEQVNTNAYREGTVLDLSGIDEGKIYFVTFRCPRDAQSGTLNGYATLNYDRFTDMTYFDEGLLHRTYLPLAYACLYAQFVRGNFESDFDTPEFRYAIDFILDPDKFGHDWRGNKYLSFLLDHTPDINGRSDLQLIYEYWLTPYKLTGEYYFVDNDGKQFDLLANCYVFVLGVTELTTGERGTAMMYAALRSIEEDPPNDDVPEPATLLLWTLGGLGLAGTSWLGKRRKNLALV